MKYKFLFFLLFYSAVSFSQIKPNKKEPVSFDKNSKTNGAAMFVNARFVSSKTLEGINPLDIENATVRKGDTLIGSEKFSGKIFVTLKKGKEYGFVSLREIKHKFTDVASDDVLYMINGNFIQESEEHYFIEESYLLRAFSQTKYNPYLKEKGIEVINILTKTPQNLNAKIHIRGGEEMGVK